MNKGSIKTYQDLLLEFSKTPREDVEEFSRKYNEVLKEFLKLDKVYTIASKNSTIEEVKNNTAQPLCALNHKKLPCIWFFTERNMAEDFVKHFGFIKDDVEYIRELNNEEMIETIKQGVFNGVYQFDVDEGKCAMVIAPYDLLNMHFEMNGQEKFLEHNQYSLMILLTMMKFHGKLVYGVESDEKNEEGKSLLATDRQGVLHFFVKKEDSDIHKYDIGFGRKDSKQFNIIELRNIINLMVDKIENVRFEISEDIININIKKLAYILNEMTKIKK